MRRPGTKTARGARFFLAVLFGVSSISTIGSAQRRGPVLHEPIPEDPADDRRARVASELTGFRQSPNGLVPDTREPDAPIPEPRLSGFDRPFTPDLDTRAPDILAGANVFEPSISPYERVSAFDTVLSDFTLGVENPVTHPVTKAPPLPGTDTFRARLDLRVVRDQPIRIPSVIAGSKVVDSNVTIDGHAVVHRIESDGAENWFLTSRESGMARIRLSIAAPRAAFGGPFGNPEWGVLPHIRELPDTPKRSAASVLLRLGISQRDLSPAQAVERLTKYFREFRESNDRPEMQGDPYRTIALSKKGVCRHRAYAFLVTATALGLPTRLLMNGEHAWVEVHNGTLYKRIDLGGGGTIINPETADIATYRDPVDPFAWPEGSSSGRNTMQKRAQGQGGNGGTNGKGPNGTSSALASSSARPFSSDVSPDPMQDTTGPRAAITLSSAQKEVLRGTTLEVSGDVRAGDHACPFVGVDLVLTPNTGSLRGVALGALPTDAQGHFAGTLSVPTSISLGEYRLVAKTRGGKDCGRGESP